ncbi:MAG: hypothetical protein NC925_05770 [Candidatus Omnitrophica bacterium]|nr:hypothetical protein [Candidatus Omnitrophota bacterium]
MLRNIKKILLIFTIFTISKILPLCAQDLVGKEVILKPNGSVVYFGIDKKSFNRALGNLMGDYKRGYLVKFLSNHIYEINQETKAIVLEISYYEDLAKVIILDGVLKNKIGWVLLDQIQACKE